MANNQVILFLFYGEICKSLSTAIPQNVSMSKRNASTSIGSPTEDKAPLYLSQASAPRLEKSGRALTLTTAPQFPNADAEPSEGSWIAALIIGIILISMIMAIIIILLWKACRRPVLVDSNWAGRSPFADGDTPDVFMDPDQATKRSSVLFMLPWKFKQDTNLQNDPTASENAPRRTTGTAQRQVPPPAADCPGASAPAPRAQPPPAPPWGAASCARHSCPHPAASPPSPGLPPPPEWLRAPAEGQRSGLSTHQELQAGAEEPLPPPPPLLIQETHEPLPQLPQPEHPL
ncbi:EVI2B protein, partial [Oceanites oceanicus]|nr:EVI2B protein [Oceanites oceanicus]